MGNYDLKFIKKGMLVEVSIEKTQGNYKTGHVEKILTRTPEARKIKVKLRDGTIGFITYIPTINEVKLDQMKLLNKIMYERQKLFSIWNNKERKYFSAQKHRKLISFIFSEKEDAEKFLEQRLGNHPDYIVNSINRKKLIVKNFEVIGVHALILDGVVITTLEDLKEREMSYKNMLTQTNRKK